MENESIPMVKKRLGKGLSALIPEIPVLRKDVAPTQAPGKEVGWREIDVTQIAPNRYQPRNLFDEGKIQELANSIRQKGVIQPILVRSSGQGQLELIAGERRLRAAKLLGMQKIPAIIREIPEREALEIALIENLQREDLNSIEEAQAYQRLAVEFGMTQEDIGSRVGKDRVTISNAQRLLALPESVQKLVMEGTLTAGHGRALLSLPEAKQQEEWAAKTVRDNLSVRQLERLVTLAAGVRRRIQRTTRVKAASPEVREMEENLSRSLGTKVRIWGNQLGGHITIEFYSLDDLERLTTRLLKEGV